MTKEVGSMMGWYGGGAGWAMMITNSLIALLLLGVVVWAVARLTANGQRRSAQGPDDAGVVLDRRFAAGEIDTDAYRAGVRELTAGRRS